jgi:hypothetical protein
MELVDGDGDGSSVAPFCVLLCSAVVKNDCQLGRREFEKPFYRNDFSARKLYLPAASFDDPQPDSRTLYRELFSSRL